jgi:Nucleotidyltransferase domain
VDLGTRVPELLRQHPSVTRVELVGSRARGTPTALSDWDFGVETDDLAAVKPALPGLVAPLEPLAEQWDPLGEPPSYMLVVRGPVKIDLIFSHEAVPQRPPWRVGPDTLAALDAHFWDWILWLAAKRAGGRDELVRGELKKMHGFLLGPLGVDAAPETIAEAVGAYLSASGEAERRFGMEVPRALRDEVLPALGLSNAR